MDDESRSVKSPLEVEGEIVFESTAGPFTGGTVNVFLEDVSRADADALPMAKLSIPNVAHEGNTELRLPFKLCGEMSDRRASYCIRVHVDLHGDGQVHRGDYITMQSYPVFVQGNQDRKSVIVRRVE